jgi:hypothetical protein
MTQYKTRKAKFETLEGRSMMAADISFNANNGALALVGTAGGDTIRIQVFNDSQASVRVGSLQRTIDPRMVKSIFIDAKAGSDSVLIGGYGMNALNPERIDILMGTGTREVINTEKFGSVGVLNIDARASLTTSIRLWQNSYDQVFVDMGNDSASDTLSLEGCDVNRLQVNMGGGADTMTLNAAGVQSAKVNMGSGNDRIFAYNDSFIASGTIDGGADTDTIDPTLRRLSRRFERYSR